MSQQKFRDVYFVDTTWRDGNQSNWGMMMRHGMFDAIASDINEAGFKHVDTHTGDIWQKTSVRYFKEDPFDTFDIFKKKINTHCFAGHGQGFRVNFLEPWPGNFSLLKLLNEVNYETTGSFGTAGSGRRWVIVGTADEQDRELPYILPMARKMGITDVNIGICYYPNPRRTDAYYAGLASLCCERFKCESLSIKDAGGLLTEQRIRTLYPAIRQAVPDNVLIEIHTHGQSCNSGQVVAACLEMGIDGVWTCIPPLAWGTAQVSVQNVLHNAEVVGRKCTPLNMTAIKEVERKLNIIADVEKFPKCAPIEYDAVVFKHQLPGGVVGTLKMQLTNLGIPDKFDEVLENMAKIIVQLGNPISITPYSQWLVAQATMNVLTGEDFKESLDGWVQVAAGIWGQNDSGAAYMDQNLKDRLMADPRAKIALKRWDREMENAMTSYTPQQLKTKYGWTNVTDKEFALLYACNGPEEIKKISKPYKSYFKYF